MLIALYQLKHLKYKPRSLSCEYYEQNDIYFVSAMLGLGAVLWLTILGIGAGIITPTILLLTVTSCIFFILAYNEDIERSRLQGIEKSLEKLRIKYDIVIESLYQLLVDNGMKHLPLATIELKLLTAEQRALKVIDDKQTRLRVEEFIRTELIMVFRKKAVYKESEIAVAIRRTW